MRANRPVVLGVLGPLVIGASSLGAVACSSTGTSSSASSTAAPATTAGAPSTGAPGTSAPTSATSRPASSPLPSSTGSTSTTAPAVPGQVAIVDYAFAPETVTVKVGDTVTWTNQDGFDHWVLSEDESTLDSQALVPGQSYATTVTQPGTIAYYCNSHNGMKGTVVVA